ncbi:hypothetical protein [Maribacter sp. 2-571]|uniref:hypothetical protein n=1 Tax=Maribacter sp. 2-571 TaxID=3417569 RepID=UPI003D32728F
MRITYLLLMFFVLSCGNQHDPLIDAIDKLQKDFSEEELKIFREQNEVKILNSYHFTGDIDDPLLKEYFYSNNIKNIEYIGNILYTSLHRKLNNEPIRIDEQIKFYQNKQAVP